MARLSRRFRFLRPGHWPGPRSLATTSGVSVDVLSSGYLDVSVRRVCLAVLCIQTAIPSKLGGFPHSEIRGSTIARISPRLIAACYVLHRLSVPRHPPNALQRLIAKLSCAGTSPAQSIPQAANRQAIRPAEGGGRGPLVIGGRTQPLHNVKEPAALRPPSDIARATSKFESSDLSSRGLIKWWR